MKESIAVRPCLNSDTSEAVFITVLHKRRPVLLLGCVYRPPAPRSPTGLFSVNPLKNFGQFPLATSSYWEILMSISSPQRYPLNIGILIT